MNRRVHARLLLVSTRDRLSRQALHIYYTCVCIIHEQKFDHVKSDSLRSLSWKVEKTLWHCAVGSQQLMEAALADVDTEVLVAELKRRLDCQTKPEKHVILIGALHSCGSHGTIIP